MPGCRSAPSPSLRHGTARPEGWIIHEVSPSTHGDGYLDVAKLNPLKPPVADAALWKSTCTELNLTSRGCVNDFTVDVLARQNGRSFFNSEATPWSIEELPDLLALLYLGVLFLAGVFTLVGLMRWSHRWASSLEQSGMWLAATEFSIWRRRNWLRHLAAHHPRRPPHHVPKCRLGRTSRPL